MSKTQAYNQIMKNTLLTVVLTFAASAAFAQDASQVQKLFEAGQYQRVVDSAQPGGDPAVLYTAAQSHQKLGENDRALETYSALAARDEGDIWHYIGLSGQQLMQDDVDGALGSARHAIEMDGGMAEAHYRMANHFEQFLKLAPDAPERPEVMQIMKTVRGR